MVAKTEGMEHGAWGKRAVLMIFYYCLLFFAFLSFVFSLLTSPRRPSLHAGRTLMAQGTGVYFPL
jgi:hypothetical protein